MEIGIKMQFVGALFPSFFIWQMFSLSPFTLARVSLRPKISNLHSFISIVSAIIQIVVLLGGLVHPKHYVVLENRSFVVTAGDFASMTLIRITSISITIESLLKRSHQIEFLRKIDQIDNILNTKLIIDAKYNYHQRGNIVKLIVWIGMFLLLEGNMILSTIVAGMETFQMYFALYTIPLFICLMRYQQFVTYVNLLHDRYAAINEYVGHLTLAKCGDPIQARRKPTWHRTSDFMPLLVLNKLKHLRRAHRIIIEANKTLCQLFGWSMLLNITNDFFNLLINSYWLIINIINGESKLQLIGILSWGFFNITMLISVSKACHIACHEVI